ncbi:hypothetical protein CFP65_1607 [Kitasatospora sp. MMS16-BH015]|uniref:hypothetical protein n=1 Tax=Kitasatospora sp. MMS16-BH015 TaxID=2018025 RepID=UPI000CA0A7AB|nr:hypothetical protein [Kitasatospora sp. MMS16-BH015]AUG76494.1 hypothetical protein CFP65_1607 [Kitasatospora sp. MMS16-BH015]
MPQNPPAVRSLLAGVTKDDIRRDPFPHIVISDALPQELYDALAATMPTAEYIGEKIGKKITSNERYNYMSEHVLGDPAMAQVWKEFVTYHSSPEFYAEFLDLFHEDLVANLPQVEQQTGALRDLRVGRRNRDSFDTHDILMDCTAVINSAVTGRPSAYRGPHVDKPYKLFGGLFYMRLAEDDAVGGDLVLYKYRSDDPKFRTSASEYGDSRFDIDPEYVEEVTTVPYRANTLVMYPINPLALHGVSVRSLTDHQRRFIALVGDLQHHLFDLAI